MQQLQNLFLFFYFILFFLQIIKRFPNLASKLEHFIPPEFLEIESEIQGMQVRVTKRKGLKIPQHQLTHNAKSEKNSFYSPDNSVKPANGNSIYLNHINIDYFVFTY